MKIAHLPNTHWYQRDLQAELRRLGLETDATCWNWGGYLAEAVDALLAARCDIVHLHWPEALFRQPAVGLARRVLRRAYLRAVRNDDEWGRWIYETFGALKRLKAGGCRLVWTVHNLAPHDEGDPEAYDLLYQSFARAADGVIHHSNWGADRVRQAYGFRTDARQAVIPYGHTPAEAPEGMSKADARTALGLPAGDLVLLHVGYIKPRKQLDLIAEALGGLDAFPCQLVVVGAGDADARRGLLERSKGRIRFAGPLEAADLAVYARAADFFVFAPKADQLTSGGPALSETFRLPQLTTDTPYVREVLGGEALYYAPGVPDLRAAIVAARTLLVQRPGDYARLVEALAQRRGAHGWAAAAAQTLDLYTAIAGDRSHGNA